MSCTVLVPTAPAPSAPPGELVVSPPFRGAGVAARAHHAAIRLRDADRGQGTVEYVALAMLIAAVMAGVVLAAGGLKGGGIAQVVVEKVKAAIGAAGKTPKP